MKSITIAGGGLAGLSLGIVLRQRDVPVRVIEASTYPRHRVCGEFVSGITPAELRQLGIHEAFADAPRHQQTTWFNGDRIMFSETLPADGYGISRYHLDAAMADRFTTMGGELVTGQRAYEEGEGIVWATGRRKEPSHWLGLKAHFAHIDLMAGLEVHLGSGGYVGLTRVENGRVNVCGLFERRRPLATGLSGVNALITATRECGLPALAERLTDAPLVEGTLKGVNQFSLGWQKEEDSRLRIGDSAAMIPPFTGNGMTMAFQSALAAADPIERWCRSSITWSEAVVSVRATERRLFGRRLRWAQLLDAVLRRPGARRLTGWLISRGCIRFETLYRRVR